MAVLNTRMFRNARENPSKYPVNYCYAPRDKRIVRKCRIYFKFSRREQGSEKSDTIGIDCKETFLLEYSP